MKKMIFVFLVLVPIHCFADGAFTYYGDERWTIHIGAKRHCIPVGYVIERVTSLDIMFANSRSFPNRINMRWGLVLNEAYLLSLEGAEVIRKSGSLHGYRYIDVVADERFGIEYYAIHVEIPDMGLLIVNSSQDEVAAIVEEMLSPLNNSCDE